MTIPRLFAAAILVTASLAEATTYDVTFGTAGVVVPDTLSVGGTSVTSEAASGLIVHGNDPMFLPIYDAGVHCATCREMRLQRLTDVGIYDFGWGGAGGFVTLEQAATATIFYSAVAFDSAKRIVTAYGAHIPCADMSVRRTLLDGSPDSSWGSAPAIPSFAFRNLGSPIGLAVQPDNKAVIVGGTIAAAPGSCFGAVGAARKFTIIRLTDDGSLDPGFGFGGDVFTSIPGSDPATGSDIAQGVAIQSDGKIVVAGTSFRGGTVSHPRSVAAIVRYLPDGTLDRSFGADGFTLAPFRQDNSSAIRVFIHPDGSIYVAGEVTSSDQSFAALLHLDTDGRIDRTFAPEGWALASFGTLGGNVSDMVVQEDGNKFLLVGLANAFTGAPGSFTAVAIRFKRSGALDASWGTDGRFEIHIPGFTDTIAISAAQDFVGRVVISGSAMNRAPGSSDSRWFVTRLIP